MRPSGKRVYQLSFTYRGVACRETVALDGKHNRDNETAIERLRLRIIEDIAADTFDYAARFPKSKRLRLFNALPGTVKLLLKDRLEAYRDRAEKTLERSTWLCYRRDIDNVLVPWCGARDIRQLSKADVRDWVGLQSVGLKRLQNLLLPLRNVLAEAVDDGVIQVSPLDGLKIKRLVPPDKRASGYEPQPYTSAELRVLLANLAGIERWTFQLWAYAGLRTSELAGLRWGRIDIEAAELRVEEVTTVGRDKARTKTPAGRRTIPLLPAALEAVQGMRAHTQLGGDRFTVNPRGRRDDPYWDTNKLAQVWTRAHRGTGIAVRNPYQLRHTFASQLLSQGENIAYIAKLLGHKDVEMVTKTYGKWVAEGERLGFDRPPRRYGMEPLWAAEGTGT